jgi:hypothetical protein
LDTNTEMNNGCYYSLFDIFLCCRNLSESEKWIKAVF